MPSRPKLDDDDLEFVVERALRPLIATAPDLALTLASDALSQILAQTEGGANTERRRDSSVYWRSSIATSPGRMYGHARENSLVDVVRDAALALVRSDPARMEAIVEDLEAKAWPLFERIALFVLAESGNSALIGRRMVDPAIIEQDLPEHARLVRERFSAISPDERGRYIEAVESRRAPVTYSGGEPIERAEAERWVGDWRLRRLAAVREFLPDEVRARYPDLAKSAPTLETDEPEVPLEDAPLPSRNAPLDAEALVRLPIPKVVAHLRDWQPAAAPFGPTAETQGNALAAAARMDSTRYGQHAPEFIGLDPTYVRSILRGIHEAFKDDAAEVPWDPLLSLAAWAIEQRLDTPRGGFDQDPDWGWTRKEVADLIGDGLQRREHAVPLALRDQVWSLLKALSDDEADPTAQDEDREPLTAALNSVRGAALLAVITFLDWIQRQTPSPGPAMALAPEAASVLEEHLDPKRDRSVATRGAIGSRLVNLVALDAEWVRAHRTMLFPVGSPDLWRWTWRAYVVWNRPYRQLLSVFRDEYIAAIDTTVLDRRDSYADPDEHLAEHLMSFYVRGDLGIDDPLIAGLFARGSAHTRAHAIEFLGRVLRDDPTLGDEHCSRLQALLKARVSAARATESLRTELEHFGWWFTSSKCDQSWLLDSLIDVLRVAGTVEPDSLVLEKLAQMASANPSRTLDALTLMVEAPKERWFVEANAVEIQSILRTALSVEETQGDAKAVIGRLVADGHAGFEALLVPGG